MRKETRNEILAAVLLLLAGFFIRLALSRWTPVTADSIRFLSQAGDLAAGTSHLIPGDPFSALPPGYPLFIRAVRWMTSSVPFLLRVQLVLSVLTLLFVWLAARRRSPTGALVALALLAFNPWLARQQALVMSETLGAFLVAVTVLLWPAPGRPLAALPAFALGVLAVGATLVTPAAAFVAVPVLGVFAWRNRGRAALVGLMAAGMLLVLVPWQAYLLERTGRVEPLLLHPIGSVRAGLQLWLRTWSTTPVDKGVWWSLERRRSLRERAVGAGPEGALVRKALEEAPCGYEEYVLGSGYDETLREVGRARRKEHPVFFWIGLPLVRSATLWLDYRSMIGVPDYLRQAGGFLRTSYWATHVVFWCVNLVTLGFFAWGTVRAFRSRDALLLALVAGVVAYSLASAVSAMGEFRRNLTLEPALVLLVCAAPAGGRPKEPLP
ncbi:MAG TPA: hypothetical protein VL084_09155 [Thermoanaerobaculia bacterium]|nr:hypothetical protein [Thermoanaerobaculia bacterium]